jgi:hypothetical protein
MGGWHELTQAGPQVAQGAWAWTAPEKNAARQTAMAMIADFWILSGKPKIGHFIGELSVCAARGNAIPSR